MHKVALINCCSSTGKVNPLLGISSILPRVHIVGFESTTQKARNIARMGGNKWAFSICNSESVAICNSEAFVNPIC